MSYDNLIIDYYNIKITCLELKKSIILLFAVESRDKYHQVSNIFWIVIIPLNIPPSLLSSLMFCHLTNLCLKSRQIIFMRVSQSLEMFNEPTFEIWDYVYLWTCNWGDSFCFYYFSFWLNSPSPYFCFSLFCLIFHLTWL